MELFKLFGTIAIDNAQANKGIDETSDKAKSAGNSLTDLADEGEKTESKLSKFFNGVGKVAAIGVKATTVALGAATTAMTALATTSLNLGGELEQNMGGSEAVFKIHAQGMQETAKDAFSNMGLSASNFLATANKMGSLFQGAGFSIEESASMSTEAMQRAADVASIMGISTESAMEAIAGAAKGNFTMMDNLGVAMNDTTLNAYALSKGIEKSTSEMTNQEKIGLAMEMFMEKTAYAAGNYAKENETLAGSLGTAKAALSNFLSGAGTVEDVVSSFSNAADVIVKNIDDMFPKLMSGITQLVEKLIPMVPPLLQKVLPGLIEGATSLIDGLVSALPTLISVLTNSVLPQVLSGIVTIINSLVAALPQIVESLAAALPTLIPLLIDALVSIFVTICSQFGQIIQPIIDYLPEIVISLVDSLMTNLPILIQGLITLTLGIVQAIPQIIQGLVDAMPFVIESILVGLFNSLPALIQGLIDLLVGVADAAESIWASVKEAFVNVFKGIWNSMTQIFSKVGDWFGEKFGDAKEKSVKAWSDFKGKMSEKWSDVKEVFSNVGSWFSEKFGDAWNKVKNVFSGVKDFFLEKWNDIKTAFSELGTKISDAISEPVKKGINGVIGGAENIINGFFGMINNAIGAINEIPGVEISKIKLVEFTRLAKGGVVDKPTPAIFGEDGAEAVVPLEKNTGWMNKVASKLHELTLQQNGGLDGGLSAKSVELQQRQTADVQSLIIIVNKILDAILTMDENMGGHLRDALDGVGLDVNKREFARLVKESV